MVNRQIKTCRKKRHVRIDNMKEMPNLICSNAAVGGNFKSTRDNKHEMWVKQMLEEQTLNYTFAELEVLAKYILEVKGTSYIPTSFELIKIEDKIKKNSLEDVQGYITMGLTSNKVIVDFINKYPSPSFASTLNSIMANEYKKLKDEGLDSITIFHELWSLTSGNKNEFVYKAAGLGILAYFFEECEVFEK